MADAKQYEALDKYVLRLIRESSPERTVWNVEKLRQGVPTNWNYIDGCMMTALLSLYHITGDKAYFDFVEGFIGAFVGGDGSIRTLKTEGHALDDINEGRVLFELYQATGKEKYRLAAGTLRAMLDAQPRTFEGSWWHKQIYPDQVWLDGIYMAQPFSALYEKTFGAGDFSDVLRQVLLVRDRMRDQRTGLYYHGYDASRKAFWCDEETGLSRSFWLRAIGWFSVALADLIEILPEKDSGPVRDVFADLMRSLVPFAAPATASAIAAQFALIPEEYAALGQKTFDGIVRTQLSFTDDELNLNSICLVAGLGPENNRRRDGSVAYYLSEPIVQNDAKGVAPLLMCYTEIKRR